MSGIELKTEGIEIKLTDSTVTIILNLKRPLVDSNEQMLCKKENVTSGNFFFM